MAHKELDDEPCPECGAPVWVHWTQDKEEIYECSECDWEHLETYR